MLFEAGMISFLRTILIFVVIYYAAKLILRILIPYLLKWFLHKQQDKFNSYDSNNSNNSAHSEQKNTKQRAKSKLGEYVEYEEVDD